MNNNNNRSISDLGIENTIFTATLYLQLDNAGTITVDININIIKYK